MSDVGYWDVGLFSQFSDLATVWCIGFDSRRLQVFFIFAPRPAQFGAHPTLCPVTTEGSVHRGHEIHHNLGGIITFVIIRAI